MFNTKKIHFLVFSGVFLYSCSVNKSKVGEWSKKDKERFNQYIKKEEQKGHMTSFGENKQMFIDCLFKKLENNYTSFTLAMSNDKAKEEMKLCFNEVYGPKKSMKGAWNKEDVAKFNNEMQSIQADLNKLGPLKEDFLKCYFQIIQNTFPSFNDAISNSSTCQKLATDCANEIIKKE
ncbi:MAG: hypothetical protein P8I93_06880 [Crocinitomicaceae bacterium]|nr:hypothetical protein [Crocinitomicaceae bacterium]